MPANFLTKAQQKQLLKNGETQRAARELGDARVSQNEALRGTLNLRVERDLYFRARKTLSEYACEAHAAQRIST
jgi:hypothetical protein